MRRLALVALGICGAVGVVAILRRPAPPSVPAPASAVTNPRSAPALETPDREHANDRGKFEAGPALDDVPPVLTSAKDTVETQLALLAANRDDAFRATFIPSAARTVTADTIAACKAWVLRRPVKPDWEMAEDYVVDGQRVREVSMFGKSMTGFVETAPGVWLANRVWCLPPQP